ncbi:MAG TPA: PTS sugar transporter subunit IIA [bacterium]|nr:PTS sugar transporter subunit IIA [bacterium]HEX67820.1 PTS sugar transporter subunit IIA [bacterium]
MRLLDYLSLERIAVDMEAKNKEEALRCLVDLLVKSGDVEKENKEKVLEVLKEREKLGSTGVGGGVAIPHGYSEEVKKVILSVVISKKGVDFDSLDGKPVYIFFLLVSPPSSHLLHLKVLARIARFTKDKEFREKLISAGSPQEIYEIIREREEKEGMK